MYLYLDNSDGERVVLGVVGRDGSGRIRGYKNQPSRPLLSLVDKFWRTAACGENRLAGVAVRVGVGRFTATRIAVTVANILSYVRQVPVVAVADFDPALIARRLTRAKRGVYAGARYSGAARIGGR